MTPAHPSDTPLQRADLALVRLSLAPSRAAASALIKTGRVRAAGKLVGKPSALLDQTALDELEINGAPESTRGAQKLISAIATLRAAGHRVKITGKVCLDIGAARGGFTQVLLAEGATQVIALDVGHSQLLPEIRANPQVVTLEGVNARYLTRTDLPAIPQFITCDVSFISLKLIIPVIAQIAAPGTQMLLLIKPQFEVGKGNLGKGGVVRNPDLISQAISSVRDSAAANGITITDIIPSEVLGASGNQEYFLLGYLGNPD